MPEVKVAKAKTTNVIVYEYGARLDRECAATVDEIQCLRAESARLIESIRKAAE